MKVSERGTKRGEGGGEGGEGASGRAKCWSVAWAAGVAPEGKGEGRVGRRDLELGARRDGAANAAQVLGVLFPRFAMGREAVANLPRRETTTAPVKWRVKWSWFDPFIGVAPARASSSQPAATGRRGPPLPHQSC